MNDTKYYVIMDGEYSDKGVVGITTDLELAKAFCKVYNAGFGYENYWVWDSEGTEIITDTTFIQRATNVVTKYAYRFLADIIGGSKRWKIPKRYSYKTTEETTDTSTKFVMDNGNEYGAMFYVYTDDKTKADKIAYDFLAKKNAEEIGL